MHRVGRTARQGRRGTAVIFLREGELAYLNVLVDRGLKLKPLKTSYESLLPPKFVGNAAAVLERSSTAASELQSELERLVERDAKLFELAGQAFQSYVGAYAVHSADTKHVFVARSLHLGQVARSFALKTAPSKVAGKLQSSSSSSSKPQREREREREVRGGGGGWSAATAATAAGDGDSDANKRSKRGSFEAQP